VLVVEEKYLRRLRSRLHMFGERALGREIEMKVCLNAIRCDAFAVQAKYKFYMRFPYPQTPSIVSIWGLSIRIICENELCSVPPTRVSIA
jgi:hypothetical protein